MAVASVVGGPDVGERRAISVLVHLDSITDARAELDGVNEDPGDRPSGDVGHVIHGPASVGKSSLIANQKSQTLLLIGRSRWNARVQAQ